MKACHQAKAKLSQQNDKPCLVMCSVTWLTEMRKANLSERKKMKNKKKVKG